MLCIQLASMFLFGNACCCNCCLVLMPVYCFAPKPKHGNTVSICPSQTRSLCFRYTTFSRQSEQCCRPGSLAAWSTASSSLPWRGDVEATFQRWVDVEVTRTSNLCMLLLRSTPMNSFQQLYAAHYAVLAAKGAKIYFLTCGIALLLLLLLLLLFATRQVWPAR